MIVSVAKNGKEVEEIIFFWCCFISSKGAPLALDIMGGLEPKFSENFCMFAFLEINRSWMF